MTDEFGDFEEDDAFAEDGEPAPEQVTYRLHELRVALTELADRALDHWQSLSPEEQDVAYDIGVALVQQIAEDRDAGHLAHWLHELRESIDDMVPPWHLLTDDEHAVAQDLLILIMEWLVREGSVR